MAKKKKKTRKANRKAQVSPKPRGAFCERLKAAASELARENGFEIVDSRCSIVAAMFVPDQKPERRAAFSFTIVGKSKGKA